MCASDEQHHSVLQGSISTEFPEDAENVRVQLHGFRSTGEQGAMQSTVRVDVAYQTVRGPTKRRTSTEYSVYMAALFCPFCGEKYAPAVHQKTEIEPTLKGA